jgi:hypothetical protein
MMIRIVFDLLACFAHNNNAQREFILLLVVVVSFPPSLFLARQNLGSTGSHPIKSIHSDQDDDDHNHNADNS